MQSDGLQQILGALLGGSVISSLLTYLATRKKNNAQVDAMRVKLELEINDAALEMIKQYRVEVETLSAKVELLRQEIKKRDVIIKKLRQEINVLKKEVNKCEDELEIKR